MVTRELRDTPNWSDLSTMKSLTCRNHTGMRYLTKNPWQRSLHLVSADPEVLKEGKVECDCPFSDLVEIIG